jgi:protein involved in polysaccharide export with SLBB domain
MIRGRVAAFAFAALFAGQCLVTHAQDVLPGPSPHAALPGQGLVTAPLPAALPPPAPAIITDDNYKLGTGDKMKVTIYGEPDLSGDFIVDGSGEVQFPLLGQIQAAGLSVHQFVSTLTAALSAKYLRDPKVSIEIQNYRPFYIIGEVNKPGEYPFENNLNVLNAVALAGGYTYRANHSDVYIRRNGNKDETAQGFSAETKIYPGDVVRIPERIF